MIEKEQILEIVTVDGADEFARVEFIADAYYQDGTSESIYLSQVVSAPEGGGNSLLIDITKDVNFESEEDISFIKADSIAITGLDNRGASPGFEVYEVKGLHTVETGIINQEISRLIEVRNQDRDPITGETLEDYIRNFLDFDARNISSADVRNFFNNLEQGILNIDVNNNGISDFDVNSNGDLDPAEAGAFLGLLAAGAAFAGAGGGAAGTAAALQSYAGTQLLGIAAELGQETFQNTMDFISRETGL